jgi:hypothetical protein
VLLACPSVCRSSESVKPVKAGIQDDQDPPG